MFRFDPKGPPATFRAPERHLVLAVVMQEVTGLAPIGGWLEAHGRINPARLLSGNAKMNAAQFDPLERRHGFIFLGGGPFLGGRGVDLVAGGKLFGIEDDENQITHHADDDHQQQEV